MRQDSVDYVHIDITSDTDISTLPIEMSFDGGTTWTAAEHTATGARILVGPGSTVGALPLGFNEVLYRIDGPTAKPIKSAGKIYVYLTTNEDIVTVRDYIGEPDESNGWGDSRVASFIDRSDNLFLAAAGIWAAKAAGYADLADVTESGSSRRLSSLMDQALKMQQVYIDRSASAGGGVKRPTTRQITRA